MKKQEFSQFIKISNLPLFFRMLEYDEIGLEKKTLKINISKSKHNTLIKHVPNYKLLSRVFSYDHK